MKKINTVTNKFQQRRKFLLVLPLLVIPFLVIGFYALGGGKGVQKEDTEKAVGMGFNMELPPPVFDKKEEKMDKMDYYKRADEDSIRRRELMQQDPYHRRGSTQVSLASPKPAIDTQADTLLRRLDLLKQRVDQPEVVKPVVKVRETRRKEIREIPSFELTGRAPDTTVMRVDPELDKLNEMLDKIVKLQRGEEEEKPAAMTLDKKVDAGQFKTSEMVTAAAPAVVEHNQELVNGATIALRLATAVLFNGITIPKGQLAYGVVSMNNDRLQVAIHSIRCGASILTTSWQVYDMDGLPGIHIPESLGRQAARQSADQSIGSLNLTGYDPSIGAQVTGAGIQAARNLFSRKVRTIKVMVPAGYHVFLRETQSGGSSLRLVQDTTARQAGDSVAEKSGVAAGMLVPPPIDSLEPFLHESVNEGKVRLTLKGIYQREGIQWLYLVVTNSGPVDFLPDQVRCTIRQGKHLKRMAVQELPVQSLYDSLPSKVAGGSEQVVMVGIKLPVVGKDKKLVVQMVDQGEGMMLELKIKSRIWAKGR